MDRGTISVNVTFKKSLILTESQSRIDAVRLIVKSLMGNGDPMPIQMPFSSNQPANIPIAIFQSDNAATIQGVMSLNSIQVNKQLNKTNEKPIVAYNIAETMVEIKDSLFDQKYSTNIPKDQIQSITISSTMSKDENSFDEIKHFLENTEYKNIVDKISPTGFNLSYFKKSKLSKVSSERVIYAPIANLVIHTKGILLTFSAVCGGINFDTANYMTISEEQVEEFISNVNKANLQNILKNIYDE